MRDYVIVTDSASDLPKEILKEYDIPCLPLYYSIDGVIYGDEKNIEPHEFFELMRKGAMPTTMGCNPEYATEMFRSILNQGKDILHIAFSSALSVSYNSARIAAEDLKEEFPDSNIVVIDSKAASLGQGLLVYKAATLKKEGKSLEEVKQKREKILEQYNLGLQTDGSKKTLNDWFDEWMELYVVGKVKPRTVQNYIREYERCKSYIGHIKVNQLQPTYIQKMVNELFKKGYKRATVKQSVSV